MLESYERCAVLYHSLEFQVKLLLSFGQVTHFREISALGERSRSLWNVQGCISPVQQMTKIDNKRLAGEKNPSPRLQQKVCLYFFARTFASGWFCSMMTVPYTFLTRNLQFFGLTCKLRRSFISRLGHSKTMRRLCAMYSYQWETPLLPWPPKICTHSADRSLCFDFPFAYFLIISSSNPAPSLEWPLKSWIIANL